MKKVILFLLIVGNLYSQNFLEYFDSLCLEKLQSSPYFSYSVAVQEYPKSPENIKIIEYDNILIYRTYLHYDDDITFVVDEKFEFYNERRNNTFYFPDELDLFLNYKEKLHDLVQEQLYLLKILLYEI